MNEPPASRYFDPQRSGQLALGALGQHGGLGHDVGAGLEVAERLAVAPAALVAGADADDLLLIVDQQLVAARLRQDVDARLFSLLAQEPPELRDRRYVVAEVAEGRRGRLERE